MIGNSLNILVVKTGLVQVIHNAASYLLSRRKAMNSDVSFLLSTCGLRRHRTRDVLRIVIPIPFPVSASFLLSAAKVTGAWELRTGITL